MKTSRRFLVSIFIAALATMYVVSCGGGENPEEPDVKPPELVSVSPADGAKNISIGTNILATFSEPMNITTFSATSFKVTPAIVGTFSTAGNTVTFEPDNDLPYITDYSIELSTDLKDAAGNKLDTAFSWTFTTEPNTNTGKTWERFDMTGNTVLMNGVVSNGSVVVAVGDSGRIYYSSAAHLDDATSWTRFAITDEIHNLNDVAWSGSYFVAVGDAGVVWISATGTSFWMEATGNTNRNLNAVAWYTDQFIAVGDSSAIITSPDGVTSWSVKETAGLDTLYNLLDIGVMANPRDFVIIGKYADSGTIFYRGPIMPVAITSLNVTILKGDNFFTNVVRSMDLNQWVAVGNNTGGDGVSKWSPDGFTWVGEQNFSSNPVNDIAWSRNLFATVGNGGEIWTSEDALSWTDRSSANGITYNLRAITWTGSQLIVVGEDGVVLVSPAGAGTT